MEFKLGGSDEDLSEHSSESDVFSSSCKFSPPKSRPIPSCQPHNKNSEQQQLLSPSEKKLSFLDGEVRWIQRQQADQTFRELETLLRALCRKLYLGNKVDRGARVIHTDPPRITYNLLPRNGKGLLHANVVLLAENVIQTDVCIKHATSPGGVFRATALPSDVQWKLQQVQDVGNYCIRALGLVMQTISRIAEVKQSSSWSEETCEYFAHICAQVDEALGAARTTLAVPKKRSLLEICNFPATKCFNPPLPSDLLFSFYLINSNLVCAAYNIGQSPDGAGVQTVSTAQSSCKMPFMTDVIKYLNKVYKENAKYLRHLQSLLKSKSDVCVPKCCW